MEIVNNTHPDVVVMDIRLPGTSGIEACEEITGRFPEIKVIMLTSYAEDEMLFSAIRAGASGYILKQIGGEDLVRALEAVGRGEAMLDPTVTQRVFPGSAPGCKGRRSFCICPSKPTGKTCTFTCLRGQDQPGDCQSAFSWRGDRAELCKQHSFQIGGE